MGRGGMREVRILAEVGLGGEPRKRTREAVLSEGLCAAWRGRGLGGGSVSERCAACETATGGECVPLGCVHCRRRVAVPPRSGRTQHTVHAEGW
eukprot:2443647-Prymnesium_polylepis.1